ncbi:hypothetical protein EI94DRAFT_271524 [Lactarius quietus]|nr:hypothetical protein EI94DRAFT_271524 [Lactarius quietus]
MKFAIGLATFTLLFSATIVDATLHDAAAHRRHVVHVNARDVAKRASKRCKTKSPGNFTSSIQPPNLTPTYQASYSTKHVPTKSSVHKSSSQNPPVQTPAYEASGVINVNPGKCSSIGATPNVTKVSGPNGSIDWINCGIYGSGWTPARVEIEQLVTVSLAGARNAAFAPCSDNIIATFEKYGTITGIPSILLASFAMQESSCNPSAVGGAGEQGLMQITQDKCAGAPNGNCQDIDYNIKTGAEFFANLLASNNGDVFRTCGEYNGWRPGMTYSDATSAAHTSCCRCQNNLDYLHQLLNGWLQGVNAYEAGLGKYFNLNICH